MQKLVTIYLDNKAHNKGRMLHGLVEEYLQDYLQSGWTVKTIHGFGGGADFDTRGWVVALLEK